MRWLKIIVVLLVGGIFLTGCSNEKTLTCTNKEEQSGISMGQKVVMTFKNDKVSYVKMSIDNKATDSTIKDNWDMFASMMAEQFKEKEETGVSLTTKNNKEEHTFNVTLEIDLTKAKDDALEEYGLDGIANEKTTYEDTKKEIESKGFTCK